MTLPSPRYQSNADASTQSEITRGSYIYDGTVSHTRLGITRRHAHERCSSREQLRVWIATSAVAVRSRQQVREGP
eukprot:4621531-Pyramimonas_sp.AAC.1